MNNLFYTDVNNILMEYAGLKDMMNIKKVIPDMKLAKNSIDKKIIQTINIRLQKVFGGKLESFKTFLEDT